jgi:diaminopimelate epimerase
VFVIPSIASFAASFEMMIHFHKMHALGNDFVITAKPPFELTSDQVKLICNRRIGIGCDQLIFYYQNELNQIEMLIFNCDGSQTSFCGNATRCLAGLLLTNNFKTIKIKTGNGLLDCSKDSSSDLITVNIGKPVCDWSKIPLSQPFANSQVEIHFDSRDYIGHCVNVGNPHVVIFVDKFDFDLARLGSYIETHSFFPQRVNVSFAQIVDENLINLRMWERGAGLTLACGSGACATFYIAFKCKFVHKRARVEFEIGGLEIEVDENENVLMSGDYAHVFEGTINL